MKAGHMGCKARADLVGQSSLNVIDERQPFPTGNAEERQVKSLAVSDSHLVPAYGCHLHTVSVRAPTTLAPDMTATIRSFHHDLSFMA
ncbi:hypothetical protein GCM10022226_09060 [Sphaerisporangium flaviroseum]|uniref:Uncharacterized protein n=1 Tax=Sphaerisporangium flaviroseum TaxID=509199 RepID=A0ABP7HE56_9ACTN